jgi:Ca2+-binding EF-hand superfamily protein
MKKLLVTVALGAAFISAPVLAQGFGGGGRDQTRAEAQQRADMMFQMLDTNHDGTVTRAEAQQAAAQFEAQRGGDSASRGGGRMQRMMDQAFANGDSLTLQQFEARALTRFDAQDLNHDGTVTVAERQQVRDQRAQAQPPVTPVQPPRQ